MVAPLKICPKCGRSSDVAFTICECGTQLPEQTVSEVVAAWFEGEQTMYDAVHDSPEVAWVAILEMLERKLSDEDIASLAAGPLESLLAMHGQKFIERVEQQAQRNPRFNHLLGGVWNPGEPDIWQRVQKARKEVW